MLIAKNNRILSTPDRKKCLYLYGGHDVYFNSEFGNLWCYRCGSIWQCDPPVVLKETPKSETGEIFTAEHHQRIRRADR